MNRVLLVDDDPISSLSMIRQLEELGYIVTSVDDVRKATAIARALPPKIVLVNIYLHGVDSFTFTQSIRQIAGCEDAVVIGLTYHSDREADISSLRAGCDDFINQPVDFNSLKTKMIKQDEYLQENIA